MNGLIRPKESNNKTQMHNTYESTQYSRECTAYVELTEKKESMSYLPLFALVKIICLCRHYCRQNLGRLYYYCYQSYQRVWCDFRMLVAMVIRIHLAD